MVSPALLLPLLVGCFAALHLFFINVALVPSHHEFHSLIDRLSFLLSDLS